MEQTVLDFLNLDYDARNVRIFRWAVVTNDNSGWDTILLFSGDVPFLTIKAFNFAQDSVREIGWNQIVELGPQIDIPRG